MGEARRKRAAGTERHGRISGDELYCVIAVLSDQSDRRALIYTTVPYPKDNWRRPLSDLLGEHEDTVRGFCSSAIRDFLAEGSPPAMIRVYPEDSPISDNPLVPVDQWHLYQWSKRHVTIELRCNQYGGELELHTVRGARLAELPNVEVLTPDELPGDGPRKYLHENSGALIIIGDREDLSRSAATRAAMVLPQVLRQDSSPPRILRRESERTWLRRRSTGGLGYPGDQAILPHVRRGDALAGQARNAARQAG
jgi:hypothetical protein